MKTFKVILPKTFISLLLTLFVCESLSSQNYMFRHMTQRDGLPTGYIYNVIEDDKGFIWMSTNTGISQYNGYNFINYTQVVEDSTSLNGGVVYDIKQYNERTLLVASTAGFEIMNLVSKEFKLVKIPDEIPQPTAAYDIEITETNEIFVMTDVGLFYFPQLPLKDKEIIPEFFPIQSAEKSTQLLRNVIELEGENTLWFSFDYKLGKLDIPSKKLEILENLGPEVEQIIESSIWEIHSSTNGNLFISAEDGLIVWENGEAKPRVVKNLGNLSLEEIGSAGFQSITEDNNGNILLGTASMGLIIWDWKNNTIENLRNNPNNPNSINSDDVHYAFVDKQDYTWLGYHDYGISLMYSNTFNYSYYLMDSSKSKTDYINIVSNFIEDENGTGWFTTGDGLMRESGQGKFERFVLDNSQGTYNGFEGITKLDDDRFFIIRDSLKDYYSFNKSTESFTKLSTDNSERGFGFIIIDIDNNFYFGSERAKIIQVDKSTFESSTFDIPYSEDIKVPVKPVIPIKNNEDELIVFKLMISPSAPPKFEILKFNKTDETFTKLSINTENLVGFGIPNKSLREEGVYWMRITNGILKLNFNTNESEILFERDAGQLSLAFQVASIVEDKDGYLWLASPSNILKLDPLSESISFYEIKEDKKPDELFLGHLRANGNILFHGRGGVMEFNPNDLQSDKMIQDIYITEIESGDLKFNTLFDTSIIELDESDTNLSISFLGLNYKDPTFSRYRYRIKGYTDDWVDIGTQQRVFLANLPSGNYTFEVQAASRFGPYSDATASIDFMIPPPWWRTWPAYVLYAFILISSLVIFDRVQRQRVIAKERERTREKELKQAKEIEIAYENLKATQTKLIQSEKMASLGELTAGIAHEIQNPLNFVNNFSEVSAELIDEANNELDEGDLAEVKALLKDIKDNLEKITHHGKRADGIVKGMLQHSRDNSGKKETIDINQLADEYLRLAYHGFRAKDKSFNSKLETDFQKSLKKIKVVPQDIGRVILNLITNAFHAVTEKKHLLNGSQDIDYIPTVWVKTYESDRNVIVEVKDNGNGIPNKVKDKVFQPFFTTKPAGQGTGLGLSLSYDIIKAHGGEIEVISEEDQGTTFKIILPTKT